MAIKTIIQETIETLESIERIIAERDALRKERDTLRLDLDDMERQLEEMAEYARDLERSNGE